MQEVNKVDIILHFLVEAIEKESNVEIRTLNKTLDFYWDLSGQRKAYLIEFAKSSKFWKDMVKDGKSIAFGVARKSYFALHEIDLTKINSDKLISVKKYVNDSARVINLATIHLSPEELENCELTIAPKVIRLKFTHFEITIIK